MNPLISFLLVCMACVQVCCRKNVPGLTMEQARVAAPFQATVEGVRFMDFKDKGVSMVIDLRRQDGSALAIMEVEASTQHVAFAQSLREGQTYEFPKVILEHAKKN